MLIDRCAFQRGNTVAFQFDHYFSHGILMIELVADIDGFLFGNAGNDSQPFRLIFQHR